jgi:hypothetical protein
MADLDWKALATSQMHPTALRLLENAAQDPSGRFSPAEKAEEWGESLGNLSYHVRALHKAGLLKKAGTTPVRGAVKHFYAISPKALR